MHADEIINRQTDKQKQAGRQADRQAGTLTDGQTPIQAREDDVVRVCVCERDR